MLSTNSVANIESVWGPVMKTVGYELIATSFKESTAV